MITVYKYPLTGSIGQPQGVMLPAGAKVLCAQGQGGQLCLWAQVDTAEDVVWRSFVVFGTGYDMPPGLTFNHVGTVQMSQLVWHVFEVLA